MEYLTVEDDYDWVYLIVSPKNPLKDSISADTGRDRFEAAVAAVKRHPALHVWVDDIEMDMEPPHYTIRTLDALKAREPQNEFTLTIGADNLAGFRKWKDYARILTEYGVVVYPRQGFDLEAIKASLEEECPDYKIHIAQAPMVDISSTEIRNGLAEGRDMSGVMM